jgi:uncharacterized tellurite resistance protein B-like protein
MTASQDLLTAVCDPSMGTFGIFLLSIFIVALLAGAAWIGYRYIQFRSTREAAWSYHVLSTVAALENEQQEANRSIISTRQRLQDDNERDRQAALARHLASISVAALEDYPGIGPATVARLRQAGLTELEGVRHARLNLSGIGPKREQDLHAAIRQLVRDVTGRFDAGACPEAHEFQRRCQARNSQSTKDIADFEQVIVRARESLDRLSPYTAIARKVTFFGFLCKQQVVELTAKLLNAPMEQLLPPQKLPSQAPVASPPPAQVRAPIPPNPDRKSRTQSIALAGTPVVVPSEPAQTRTASVDLFRAELKQQPASSVPAPTQHPRLPHLRAVVAFAFAVARADGKVAKTERETIRKLLQQSFGHEAELVRWINPLVEELEKKSPSLDDCLPILQSLFNEKEREKLYRFACAIADAAGTRNAKEIQCLEKIAAEWGIAQAAPTAQALPESSFPVMPPQPASAKPEGLLSHDDCLAALDIAAGTPLSGDLIRRQFRLLSERNDPTKFESNGAAFVGMVKNNRAKIEQAAKLLLEQLGEKLEEEKKPETSKDLRHNPDLDSVFGA